MTFALMPPTQPEDREFSPAVPTTLGIIVNPKLHEPLLVATDGEYVGIRSLKAGDLLARLGSGYYDGGPNHAAETTDYPRSHTPSGVTKKGAGYGTSLYTALALGSYLHKEGHVELDLWPRKHNAGISSYHDDRSAEADAWWDRASAKLTEREETESTEENVDLDLSPSDLAPFYEDGEITYVNRVSVDVSKSDYVDFYRYIDGFNSNLIVAEFVVDETGTSLQPNLVLRSISDGLMNDPDLIKDFNADALIGLDVRELDAEAIRLLSLLYINAGRNDAVDDLHYRWEHNLDPETPIAQLRLFRNAQAAHTLDEVRGARERTRWDELASLP